MLDVILGRIGFFSLWLSVYMSSHLMEAEGFVEVGVELCTFV
jgi:hypothetical protein